MKSELLNDDDIVISGIGCNLSEADTLSELAEKLFGEKISISNANRSQIDRRTTGRNKFDFTFFGVSNIIARNSDPMTTQILERTFEALFDAGINPADIKASNAFVFSATSFSDFDLTWQSDTRGGYSIMGRNRCMNSNRVSYWLDLKGTSCSYDAGYLNGMQNVVNGWESIRNGFCDTALASTANFQAVPETAKQLDDFKKFSSSGNSKSFDDSADGWSQTNVAVVFVLQRAKVAKRCYAVIEHAMTKIYGDREEILQKPSQQYWEMMLKEFYTQSKINLNDIFYVEGDGTGIKEEDAEELNALTSVFCKNRKNPLLVGSIKSNIGHAEAASASCGILKAIISLEKGIIPKNLHYKSPNSLSPGLVNGKIQVVDKHVPIPPNGLIAINAHSIGGMYGHIVLRANPKSKRMKQDVIPRLVPLSVRQDEYFDSVVDKIEAEPIDPEQIGLLHDLFSKKMDRYLSRGYTILPKANEESTREHQVFDPIKRPIWFIFSGMGSQWTEMGKRLMDLPIFKESIERSHEVLKKKGLDLINIITADDPKIFDNILHSFVGIAAIQIALVDILNALDIVPDNMIGHSVGELGCSYADGCLTAEQTILCAYSRGKASIETPLTKGFMAAIGKGYNEIKDELPEGIEVACRNASDSCTISGPAELVQNYVKELQDRKVFARTVNVSNIAYHSQYIKPAAPKLLQYLQEVILEPKPRSEKWISTSILEENWDSDLAKYCSAEYHTNNLLSSVYFEEGTRKIPENAICIEVAPHGLLQAILKRSLGKECINIPMTNRTAKDPLIFFLQAVGKMYTIGLDLKIQALYPKIEYPVSRSTGSLHQFVRWQHEQEIACFDYVSEKKLMYSLRDMFPETSEDGIGYLIDDTNYYPMSVLIVLVWKIFASFLDKTIEECPVVFENVKAEKLVPISITEEDEVRVCIGVGTGQFEILTDQIIATGKIYLATDLKIKSPEETADNHAALKTDIYERFDENYIIGKYFKTLNSMEVTENVLRGKIPIFSDWLQTLESMIQLDILEKDGRSQSPLFPLSIEKLMISPESHKMYKDSVEDSNFMMAELLRVQNIVKCGGIELKGLKLQSLPKFSTKLKFQSTRFIPFTDPPLKDLWRFVDYCFGIVADIRYGVEINILEVANGVRIPSIASYLEDYFPNTKIKTTRIGCHQMKKVQCKYDLVISSVLDEASSLTVEDGFIFAICPKKRTQTVPSAMEIITKYSSKQEDFILYKKREVSTDADFITIPENETMLFNTIKGLDNKSNKLTYLIGYNKLADKIKKRLQKETTARLRWVLILDKKAPTFDAGHSFFANQLRKGLTNNIYCNGSWGSFYQRQLTEEKFKVDSVFTKVNGELTTAYIGTDLDEDFVGNNQFQIEYSGKLKDKTQVMGIASIKNKELFTDGILQWNVPSKWTLEDAATIPLSHSLVYYYLKMVANIKPRESVLITDGLSFNGQAAISVALALGLKIYSTVNEEKEILRLKKLYPDINEENILTHDDGDFDFRLHSVAKNSYPSVVVNNLEEDKLLSVINCIPNFGRIIHFGKKDLKKNNEMGMYYFLFTISFHGASSAIFDLLSIEEKKEIRDFITKGIKNGFIKPLPRKVCNSGKFKTEDVLKNRTKTLLAHNAEGESDRLCVDSSMSYIIIDDESHIGLSITEWLIHRNVRNIIISSPNPSFSKKSLRNTKQKLQRQLNVIVENGCSPTGLITRARKLAPLHAVFCIKMSENSKSLAELDKLYRDVHSQLVLITKDDSLSELCSKRTDEGYISTNFVWKTSKKLTHTNFNFMVELCGKDSVIHVSDDKNMYDEAEETKQIFLDTLPDSVQKFCDFGSSLCEEVLVIELPNLGLKNSNVKELSPIFIIPGLQDDPRKIVLPLSKKLMYPVFLVKLPHNSNEVSIEKLASLISSKIQLANKSQKFYNILGISWGSYVAMEVTRSLEKSGNNVSLMLIDVPKKTKDMRTSLEENLIDIIQTPTNKVACGVSQQGSSLLNLDKIIKELNLSEENAKYNLKDGINFIYNYLQAIFNYDHFGTKLKGPLTVIKSEEMDRNFLIEKICRNVTLKNLSVSQTEVLSTKEVIDIIHSSAITISMSDHTIQQSYRELEKFLTEEKLNQISDKILMDNFAECGAQFRTSMSTYSLTPSYNTSDEYKVPV